MVSESTNFVNPYPGARPLRTTESGLLLGRDEKLTELVDAIRATPVVEFTAPSGLGKSSLLEAGVVPRLAAEGFEVAPLRSWAELAPPKRGPVEDANPITDYYAAAVSAALLANHIDDGGHGGALLLDFVSETYGPTLVLIFDQFEELLRDDPTLGRRFLERVVWAARSFPFHQVISMRSEFKEELRNLEEKLRYNQWVWIVLDDVDEEVAADIVVAPLRDQGDKAAFSWNSEVAAHIATRWKEARRLDWKVGLLHLQAFLWSVVQQLAPPRGTKVTLADVSDLLATWGPSDPSTLFRAALTVYVDLRIGTPADSPDPDIRQAMYSASRYAPELSSAGYKLVRDTVELARFAFPGVKGELLFDDSFIAEAVRTAEHELMTGDIEFALRNLAKTLPEWLDKAHSPGDPLPEGDENSTAGSMAGHSPLEAACAEIAAYERSLQLLAERALVRLTPSLDGSRRVALIHDGFGEAIKEWAAKVSRDPLAPIESLTAVSAKQLLRGLGEEGLTPSRLTVTGRATVENVRWIGCYITATIRDVVFKNCALNSTLFKDCVLENVRFDNCEMRGALFLGCTFMGKSGTVIEVLDTAEKETREKCRVSALTVKASCMADGGLTFTGLTGSGLLFEGCHGGPWKLVKCDLRHVSVDGACDPTRGQEPLSGSVDGCPSIVHLSISGDVSETTLVKDSKVRLGSYPADHRLASEGKTWLEFTAPDQIVPPVTQPPAAGT